jgi:hypothetical protein
MTRPKPTAILVLLLASAAACRGVLGIDDLPARAGDGGAAADDSAALLDGAASDAPIATGDGAGTDGGPPVDAGADVLLGGDADRRWAHWPVPPTSPSPASYALTTDTVFDSTTGLMWQRDPSTPATMEWATALGYCTTLSLGGYTGWRLPTRIELLSILDYGQALHLTSSTVFPNRPAPPAEVLFWSSSTDTPGSQLRWYVNSFDGSVGSISGGSSARYAVRCVRLGKTGQDTPRYVVSNGAVLDPRTGLRWEAGMRATTANLTDAQAYCQTLSLGGFASGWRLPTIRELHTLYDETQPSEPFWDQAVFTMSGGARRLWSGTLRTNPANKNYVVDFLYANTYAEDPALPNGVRCVR